MAEVEPRTASNPPEGEVPSMSKPSEGEAPTTTKPLTQVMIAVNQSSKGYPKPSISSHQAFDWILKNLIKPCCRKEYKLLIVHVQVPDEDGLEELDSVYASPSDFQHLQHKERGKGLALIKEFILLCKEAEIECEGWIKKGDPKEIIVREVNKMKPDILVMGSRGLGTLQRIFVGGTSSYCSKKVDCPILIIKRDPSKVPDDPMDD